MLLGFFTVKKPRSWAVDQSAGHKVGEEEQSKDSSEPSAWLCFRRCEQQDEVTPGKHAQKPTAIQPAGSLPVHGACRHSAELLELVLTLGASPWPASVEELSGGPRWHLHRALPHMRALSGSLPADWLPAMGASVLTGLRRAHISTAALELDVRLAKTVCSQVLGCRSPPRHHISVRVWHRVSGTTCAGWQGCRAAWF